jgi:pimeloyl-ACP methyl ester carboxylesterase
MDALNPAAPRSWFGVVPNEPHQEPGGIVRLGRFQLAIVEFDDQGRCYTRSQMEAVDQWLGENAERDVIIVVFVHGWKHDARSDDGNLLDVMGVLDLAAQREAASAQQMGSEPRPVLGVFVGWRGMSLFDRWGVLDNLTFWDRQQAGRRVATGSVRELFGRFRHYRNRRVDAGHAPLLVVVGHSFGGMIVFSALAQSLIEAASEPTAQVRSRFADLVLLVNPAIEAVRYLPIYDLVRTKAVDPGASQTPPIFISVTARNDWATGLAFPIGNAVSFMTESWRGKEERQAMVNTIGHVGWMITHELTQQGTGYALSPAVSGANENSFWVVRASPAVVNGHNEIFRPIFLEFVADQVFRQAQNSRLRALARKPRES